MTSRPIRQLTAHFSLLMIGTLSGLVLSEEPLSNRVEIETRPVTRFELKLTSVQPRLNMTTVEPVVIDVVLRNISETPHRVWSIKWAKCLRVIGPDGEPGRLTWLGSEPKKPTAGSRFSTTLPAGEELKTRCYLNELYDVSLPGKYKIWCEWSRLHGPNLVETYKSEPIEILLISPSPSEDLPPGSKISHSAFR